MFSSAQAEGVDFDEGEDGEVVGDEHGGSEGGERLGWQLLGAERGGHGEVDVEFVEPKEGLQDVHEVLAAEAVPIAGAQHEHFILSVAPRDLRQVEGHALHHWDLDTSPEMECLAPLGPKALVEALRCREVVAGDQASPPDFKLHS